MTTPPALAGMVAAPSSRGRTGLWLMLLGAVLLFSGLGSYPLLDRDESRYGQAPREMLEVDNWMVPRLYGEVYTDKPPLMYWAVMASFSVFGRTEFAARLPVVLSALALLAGVYWLSSGMLGARGGFLTGFVLLTMLLFFGLGRYLVLDGMLSALTVLAALLTFANLPRPPDGGAAVDGAEATPGGWGSAGMLGPRTPWRSFLAWALLGLAVLVKGPVALVLFGSPFILLRIWEHGPRWLISPRLWWRLMVDVHLPVGLPVTVLIAAPWFILMNRAVPGFLHTFFFEQNLQRFASNAYSRAQPVYFFLTVAIAGIFPWTTFVPGAVMRLWRADGWRNLPRTRPLAAFGVVLAAFPILFFSLSQSKLIPYIAPCFPGFALLLGWYFEELMADPEAKPPRFAARVLGSAALAVGVAPWIYFRLLASGRLHPNVLLPAWPLAFFAAPMLGLGLYLALFARRAGTAAIVAATGAAMVAFLGFASIDGLTERVGLGFSHAALMVEIAAEEPHDSRPLYVFREKDEHASFYFYCADWRSLRLAERDPAALRAQLGAVGAARLLLHHRDLNKVNLALGAGFDVQVIREVGNSVELSVEVAPSAEPAAEGTSPPAGVETPAERPAGP